MAATHLAGLGVITRCRVSPNVWMRRPCDSRRRRSARWKIPGSATRELLLRGAGPSSRTPCCPREGSTLKNCKTILYVVGMGKGAGTVVGLLRGDVSGSTRRAQQQSAPPAVEKREDRAEAWGRGIEAKGRHRMGVVMKCRLRKTLRSKLDSDEEGCSWRNKIYGSKRQKGPQLRTTKTLAHTF